MLVATRLNPLVYIKIMLLVGVFSSSYDNSLRLWSALGFLGASGVRFCGLPAFGRVLHQHDVLASWSERSSSSASTHHLVLLKTPSKLDTEVSVNALVGGARSELTTVEDAKSRGRADGKIEPGLNHGCIPGDWRAADGEGTLPVEPAE